MKEIGGGGVAVALALLGLFLIIMAVHGSYYAVWRVLSADAGTFALYKGSVTAQQGAAQGAK